MKYFFSTHHRQPSSSSYIYISNMRTRSQTKEDDTTSNSTPTREGEPSSLLTPESISIDDIDSLLSLAKKNLIEKKKSRPVDNTQQPSDDLSLTFERETQGPSETFKEIQQSWKKLPKLDPGLAVPVKLDSKSRKVVKLVGDTKSAPSVFRKVVDPVRIAKQEKLERESNAGDKWFNMPKPDLTPQLKRDLQLLKMRNVLDPKRFYKKDNSPLPTYFQTGTIVEGNTEYYSARISRKERRQTIADEILSDVSSKAYFKRKYTEIQSSKMSGKKAHYKKLKAMRKKL